MTPEIRENIRSRIAAGEADMWDAAVLWQHVEKLESDRKECPWCSSEEKPTLERYKKLEADAWTVAHLRSIQERIVEGNDSGHSLSDAEVAGRVRMLTHKDLDHESVCVMARDRIIALSDSLHKA